MTDVITRRDLAQERADRIAGWFKDHRAEYTEGEIGGVRVERLVWKKPGTLNCRVDYACHGGTLLFVAGDLGDAIYNAGGEDLAWWAASDFGYFAGKCIASEHGRGYETYDARAALQDLASWEKDAADEQRTIDPDLLDAAKNALQDGQFAWQAWLRDNGAELLGDEWWESAPNWGVGPDQRCEAHLVGLKLAIAQLRAAGGAA